MSVEDTVNEQLVESGDSGNTSRRVVVGRVISSKMDRGVSVKIERLIRHPVYGKFVRRTTKVLAHDEDNSCKAGDKVAIKECRPISKHKSWRVVEIIETSEIS